MEKTQAQKDAEKDRKLADARKAAAARERCDRLAAAVLEQRRQQS